MSRFMLMGLMVASAIPCLAAGELAVVEQGAMPRRIHAIEDFETEIERRWWLRGKDETENLAPTLSRSLPNRRALRASETNDFDQRMGDARQKYKAVVFNPVPGPPMGGQTRLTFRYWIHGADRLRVQIYSLTRNYHRRLELTGLPQAEWRTATVDMTQARRPDGSGGPLSEDERIDDIQFYVSPDAELLIDDIVLYDAAKEGEAAAFPRRPIFTAWFDTGEQGREWPGDFEIVPHAPPLTWDAARSIENPATNRPWLRVSLRGSRTLGEVTHLRFRYHLTGADALKIELAGKEAGSLGKVDVGQAAKNIWSEATAAWKAPAGKCVDEIRFHLPVGATLLVDDLLLYEP